MASQCKAVGEVVQIEETSATETMHPSSETFQGTQVPPRILTALTLDAMGKRKGWDPTVGTIMDQCNSLGEAKDKNFIPSTLPALRQEITHVADTRMNSAPLTKSSEAWATNRKNTTAKRLEN